MNLDKKWIVITGAGGGIGQELCARFSEQGASVLALDVNIAALKTLAQKAKKSGAVLETKRHDVTSDKGWDKLKNFLLRKKIFPRVWVNNAGVAWPTAFIQQSEKHLNQILNINMHGTIKGTRLAIEIMSEQHEGLVVNVASVAGHIPGPFLTAYAASKHAIVGFTRSLQMELKLLGSPIKCLLVSPGFCDTALMTTNPDVQIPHFLKSTPEKISKEILSGVLAGKDEIYPGTSAALMMSMYKYAPRGILLASRWLGARSLREALGLEALQLPRSLS